MCFGVIVLILLKNIIHYAIAYRARLQHAGLCMLQMAVIKI